MHIVLTGATGLVGSAALDAMLKMKDVTKISILSRREVQMAKDRNDPRVNVIIHKDFEKYDAPVLEQLKGATGCVWALGISQTQVSSEQEYAKITKDMALAAAKAFSSLAPAASSSEDGSGSSSSEGFRFVYVAGGDTTTTPGRFTAMQARVKGETELELAEMTSNTYKGLLRASSVRPFYVDQTGHEAIRPYTPTPTRILRASEMVLGPPIRSFFKSFWSPTGPLGEFLAEVAMGKHDGALAAPEANKLVMLGNGAFPVYTNTYLQKVKGL